MSRYLREGGKNEYKKGKTNERREKERGENVKY
jgi:hypothetical protein